MILEVSISAIILFIVLVLVGTVLKTGTGLNIKTLYCPRCIRPIARGSGVAGVWHFFFGGAACSTCHSVVDKWGRERLPGEKFRKSAIRRLNQKQ